VLRSQQVIKRTLTASREADVALVGIGNLDPATSGFVKAGFITIAVAMGREKVKAILGGLRTCTIKVLVTDDQAAGEVLSLSGSLLHSSKSSAC
jgi:DNA-binding transcriptional regulator LsrR (DeoR family)